MPWFRRSKAEGSPAPSTPEAPIFRLRDLIELNGGVVDLSSSDRSDALREMLDSLAANDRIRGEDVPRILESLLARETMRATTAGEGFAVPHPLPDASSLMPTTLVALGRSCEGINWGEAGGNPVHVVLLKLGPAHATDANHLRALELCARVITYPHARERLLRPEFKDVFLFLAELDAMQEYGGDDLPSSRPHR